MNTAGPARWTVLAPALLCALLAPRAAPAQGLTIDQAIALAQRSSLRVAGAEAAVRRAQAGVDTIRALRWPTLSALGAATYTDVSLRADLGVQLRDVAGRFAIPPQLIALVPDIPLGIEDRRYFGRAQLQATVPLYTGGRIGAGLRNARLEVTDARELARAVSDSVIVELVDRYFGLRLARQAASAGRLAVDVLQRVRRNADLAERYGLLPRRDTTPSDVARAEASQRRNEASRQADLALYGLAATLGVTADSAALTPATPFFVVPDLEPVDSFVARAEQRFPGLGRLRAGGTRAREGIAAVQGGYLPQVLAFGAQQLYQSALAPGLTVNLNWSVGVLATWTLFDGPGRRGRLDAARAQEREVELRTAQAARDVELLVRQQYQAVEDARDQLATRDAASISAEQGARAERLRLAQGFSTETRVGEREVVLAVARVARLQSLYVYAQALVRLLEASGEAERFGGYAARGVDQER